MTRMDISETIRRIDFPKEIWEWLDLLGEVLYRTQVAGKPEDENFIADTPFKRLLLYTINKDLSTLNAIYTLLRCELIHQVSTHVRLLCESLITLKYISLDSSQRSVLFLGYADIERYKILSSLLDWEGNTAEPSQIEKIRELLESATPEYEKALRDYTFINRSGRQKPFSNWCNKTIMQQARECGDTYRKLYELVYRQMSAYVHGSAWSLRRQMHYSGAHYRVDAVLNDIAQIVRIALIVWVEWANFLVENLGWKLEDIISDVPGRLAELDRKLFLYRDSG